MCVLGGCGNAGRLSGHSMTSVCTRKRCNAHCLLIAKLISIIIAYAEPMTYARADVAERDRVGCGYVLVIFCFCECENDKLIGLRVSKMTQRGDFGRRWSWTVADGVGWCARGIPAPMDFNVNYCRRECFVNVGLEETRYYCKRWF